MVSFWMVSEALESLSALGPQLTDEERLIRDAVRRFVRERYLPRAAQLFADEAFPRDLISRSSACSARASRVMAARA